MGRNSGGGGRGGGGGGGGSGGSASEEKFAQFTSTEAADEWAAENTPGLNDLTEGEYRSLSRYTRSTYYGINKFLRTDDYPATDVDIDGIQNIDKAMSKNSAIVKNSFTAYRGWGEDFFADKPVGSSFTDKGFVSTSVNPNHDWGANVATVRVPVGSRGRYVKLLSGHPEEYEFLANRGQTYRVVKNDADGIIVEIVP